MNKVLLSGKKPPEDFLLPRLFFLKRKALIERSLNGNQMNSKERTENYKSKSSLSSLKLKDIVSIYFSYLCKKSNKRTHSAEGFLTGFDARSELSSQCNCEHAVASCYEAHYSFLSLAIFCFGALQTLCDGRSVFANIILIQSLIVFHSKLAPFGAKCALKFFKAQNL